MKEIKQKHNWSKTKKYIKSTGIEKKQTTSQTYKTNTLTTIKQKIIIIKKSTFFLFANQSSGL